MRKIGTTIVSFCIAVGLVVSMSSTAAWSEEPAPETPVTEGGGDDTTGEGTEGEVSEGEGADGEEGVDTQGEDQVDPETGEVLGEGEGEPEEPTITEEEREEVELDVPVFEAPETMDVTGLLVVSVVDRVPDAESARESDEEYDVGVAIDGGPIVTLDPADVPADAATGQTFTGTLKLSDEAQDVVETEIADAEQAGEDVELGDAVISAAIDGAELEASGTVGPQVAVDSATTRQRSVDLVYFTSSTEPDRSESQISGMLSRVSNFWKVQSGNRLQLNKGVYRRVNVRDRSYSCSPGWESGSTNLHNLWNYAAYKVRSDWRWWDYLSGGRHLALFVDESCGGTTGRGSVGSRYTSGGLSWNNLKDADLFDSSNATIHLKNASGSFAHELGHNLKLAHSNARQCLGNTTDNVRGNYASTSGRCREIEYGDMYSVMGRGAYYAYNSNYTVGLNIAQRDALGFADGVKRITKPDSGYVKTSKGYYKDYTLQALGRNTGQRGLRIDSPTGGTMYVEFRSRTGYDSGQAFPSGYYFTQGGNSNKRYALESYSGFGWQTSYQSGVRVLKLSTKDYGSIDARQSHVLSIPASSRYDGRRTQTLRTRGDVIQPYDSTVKIEMRSTINTNSNSSAVVRVHFTSFSDVSWGNSFNDEIEWMDNNNIFTGGANKKYKPLSHLSRSAMAAFLYRTAGRPAVDTSRVRFSDVPRSHPYFREIQWMYQRGIFKGSYVNGKRNYKPDSHLSRTAMAAFLYRYQRATTRPTVQRYRDIPKHYRWFKEVTWMWESGKFRPSSGRYDPNGHISRAAMAAFLSRM